MNFTMLAILAAFGDFSGYLSTFPGLLSTLYCLKSVQDTVRNSTSVIEWLPV